MQDHGKKTVLEVGHNNMFLWLEARAEKKDIDVNVLLYAKTPRKSAS